MTAASPFARRPFVDYRAVWRWHFYAGLFCVPFVVILAITGSIYLFKPQVEGWLDRPYNALSLGPERAGAAAEVSAALAAVPGSRFSAYEVRANPADAARVLVAGSDGVRTIVYVRPDTGAVLKVLPEEARLMQVVKTIHGELLAGEAGSILVELAGAWAIVMVVTGLYLWWPREAKGLAGVLYPRLRSGPRLFWRDLHAVTGIWISAFAIFLLLTALPWTTVWAGSFKEARRLTGLVAVKQDWTQSRVDEHAEHRAAAAPAAVAGPASLGAMIRSVRAQGLPPPVLLLPPAQGQANWTARSDAQNRPQRVTLTLDPATGEVLKRRGFAAGHPIDRAIGYGIAAHEGQLFGLANQLLGVFAALGLILLSVSGYVMWWRRRPQGRLGAPAAPADPRMAVGLWLIIVALGLFLPLLGASLIAIGLVEWLILSRLPPVARWLGLRSVSKKASS